MAAGLLVIVVIIGALILVWFMRTFTDRKMFGR